MGEEGGAALHLGKIPAGWEGEHFPDPLAFLAGPFLDVIPTPSLLTERKPSDVQAFIGWLRQWNSDSGEEPRGCQSHWP